MRMRRWLLAATIPMAAGLAACDSETFDFGIEPKHMTVRPGESFTFTVGLIEKHHFNAQVSFVRVTGLPPGGSARFEPQVLIGPSTRLTTDLPSDAAEGEYQPRVFAGEEGYGEVSRTFELTVSQAGPVPTFTLQVSTKDPGQRLSTTPAPAGS